MEDKSQQNGEFTLLVSPDDEDVLPKETYPDLDGIELDEKRRAFIFGLMANSEIEGKILIENCDVAEKWIKNGIMPQPAKGKLRSIRVEAPATGG